MNVTVVVNVDEDDPPGAAKNWFEYVEVWLPCHFPSGPNPAQGQNTVILFNCRGWPPVLTTVIVIVPESPGT